MYVFHVTARVAPGREAEYERWKVEEGEIQRIAPGFIKRLLVKDKVRPGVYHYISFWESSEECARFSSSDAFKSMHANHNPGETFTEPMERYDVDVIFDEVAESATLSL
jgi:heme-degrading monooxygenase HmoA